MRTVILFGLQAEQSAGLFNAVKVCAAVHAEVLLPHPLLCTIRLDHHKAVVLAEQVFQGIIYQHGHQPRPNGGRGNAMKKPGGSVRNCRAFTMKKKFYSGPRRKGCEGWTGQATGASGANCRYSRGAMPSRPASRPKRFCSSAQLSRVTESL